MAISFGTTQTATHKTSSSSWAFAWAGSDLAAGTYLLVVVATDNPSNTTGSTNFHTGLSDARGHAYTKIREQTRGGGAAAAGVTLSVWLARLTSGLLGGEALTLSLSAAVTAKAALLTPLSVPGTLVVRGHNGIDTASTSIGITLSGLPTHTAGDRLFVGALGYEGLSSALTSYSSTYTLLGTTGTTGGTANTNIAVRSIAKVVAANTETTSFAASTSSDMVAIILALDEFPPTAGVWGRGELALEGEGALGARGAAWGQAGLALEGEGTLQRLTSAAASGQAALGMEARATLRAQVRGAGGGPLGYRASATAAAWSRASGEVRTAFPSGGWTRARASLRGTGAAGFAPLSVGRAWAGAWGQASATLLGQGVAWGVSLAYLWGQGGAAATGGGQGAALVRGAARGEVALEGKGGLRPLAGGRGTGFLAPHGYGPLQVRARLLGTGPLVDGGASLLQAVVRGQGGSQVALEGDGGGAVRAQGQGGGPLAPQGLGAGRAWARAFGAQTLVGAIPQARGLSLAGLRGGAGLAPLAGGRTLSVALARGYPSGILEGRGVVREAVVAAAWGVAWTALGGAGRAAAPAALQGGGGLGGGPRGVGLARAGLEGVGGGASRPASTLLAVASVRGAGSPIALPLTLAWTVAGGQGEAGPLGVGMGYALTPSPGEPRLLGAVLAPYRAVSVALAPIEVLPVPLWGSAAALSPYAHWTVSLTFPTLIRAALEEE